MVRLSVFGSSLVILALIGARPVAADPITFTGNVANDFKPSPSVNIVPGMSDPMNIGQPQWMTNGGYYSGWAVKDIRMSYDAKTDTLFVGVNTFTNKHGQVTVLGDAYGTGTQTGANQPNFGGDKSFTIALAPNGATAGTPGNPVFVVGIPADKANQGGTKLDGFNAASYKNTGLGIEYSYGKTLTQNLGNVAFQPSPQHPGLEFTIPNFSKIPGLNPSNGIWLSAYGGSASDGRVGEYYQPWVNIPNPEPQNVPEPATVLAWSLVAGAAAYRVRRRRAQA